MLNLFFVWPFKFIRWCIRKIRDKRYDIDFSDYPDDWKEDDENDTYLRGDFMPQSILKLEYKLKFFDVSLNKAYTSEDISITKDGAIVCKEYIPFTSEPYSIREEKCSLIVFKNLCERILNCIETADRKVMFIDDSSAELTIYYQDGNTKTVDRGLGNENKYIEDIMQDFFEKHLK